MGGSRFSDKIMLETKIGLERDQQCGKLFSEKIMLDRTLRHSGEATFAFC